MIYNHAAVKKIFFFAEKNFVKPNLIGAIKIKVKEGEEKYTLYKVSLLERAWLPIKALLYGKEAAYGHCMFNNFTLARCQMHILEYEVKQVQQFVDFLYNQTDSVLAWEPCSPSAQIKKCMAIFNQFLKRAA